MKTKKSGFFFLVLSLAFFFSIGAVLGEGRMGVIRMTDGTVHRGEILIRGDLRLVSWAEDELGIETEEDLQEYDFIGEFYGRERRFTMDVVDSIRLEPRPDLPSRELPAERLEQKWDWKNRAADYSGDEWMELDEEYRNKKVYIGDPFPVRELQAVVTFNSGEVLSGSLSRFGVYIYPEDAFTAKQIVVRSKEQGEEGESLEDLHHVESIRFLEGGRSFSATRKVEFRNPVPDDAESVWGVTRQHLSPVEPKPVDGAENAVFKFSELYGEELFLAAKINGTYYAGWKDRADEKLYSIAERHVMELRDFYNERELLGVYDVEGSHDVLTLVRLRRHVPETSVRELDPERFGLDADRSMEFYRLSVWRWRFDPEVEEMILMGRGSFFRKELPERGAETPPARATEALWLGDSEEEEKIIIDSEIGR